jgi:hypothetical protein
VRKLFEDPSSKSMYFMGDLRDLQGQFWLYVILGLRAVLERNPRVRCDSSVYKIQVHLYLLLSVIFD